MRGLFTRFQSAHEAEDQTRATQLARKIFEELEVHTTMEETVFYPAARDVNDEVHEIVVEGLEAKKRELGAPTLADKIDLTKAELTAKAREQEIPGRSTMDHDELAATVAP